MVRFREPGNKKPRIRFRVRGFRYFRQDLLVRRTPSARTSGDNKDEYECYEGKAVNHSSVGDREDPGVDRDGGGVVARHGSRLSGRFAPCQQED